MVKRLINTSDECASNHAMHTMLWSCSIIFLVNNKWIRFQHLNYLTITSVSSEKNDYANFVIKHREGKKHRLAINTPSSTHTHECRKCRYYWKCSYLINISTPVSAMHLLIPFHDFLSLNTCLASSGSLGSVGAGGAGSGRLSAMISLTFVSEPAFAVSSPSADDSLHPIIIFLSV